MSKNEDIVTFNKKKFRFSDWFAEKVIKAVAFLSIAVVILIFIFVFREAFPIFKMDKKAAASTETLVQVICSTDFYSCSNLHFNVCETQNKGNN